MSGAIGNPASRDQPTDKALRDRLKDVAGGDQVERIDPSGFDGPIETRVRPDSGEALASVLAVLNETEVAAVVRGGGSRDRLGHPVSTARVLLDTRGLAADPIVDAEDGVAYLPAGTALSILRERVRKEGSGRWQLPLDAAGVDATLGGTLAAAAMGPRSRNPRDLVLGLDVTLAIGERTKCGGRVVKNVTGYDLAKLYIGSLGTLGIIEAAWVRLVPTPEDCQVFVAPLDGPAPGLRAARLSSVRAAAWLCSRTSVGLSEPIRKAQGRGLFVVELAGDAAAVEADGQILRKELDATVVDDGEALIHEVRDFQLPSASPTPSEPVEDDSLTFRITSLASGLGDAAAILSDHGAELSVQPHRGTLTARFRGDRDDGEARIERAYRGARLAARAGHGTWRLESAPTSVREVREVFGECESQVPLFRALKAQYDPRGILNPGRQAGRV